MHPSETLRKIPDPRFSSGIYQETAARNEARGQNYGIDFETKQFEKRNIFPSYRPRDSPARISELKIVK